MSNNIPLSPCPFCGCTVQAITGFDYVRIKGDHAGSCVFVDDDPIIADAAEWNTRATRAEPMPPAGVAPEVERHYGDAPDGHGMRYYVLASDFDLHVTRLTTECDDLRAQLGRQIERSNDFASKWSGTDAERLALQSELTKARECIDKIRLLAMDDGAIVYSDAPGFIADIRDVLDSNQSAPVAAVMPERLTVAELEELEVIEALIHGQGLSNLAGTMAAARQFIDEVTRLNPIKQ